MEDTIIKVGGAFSSELAPRYDQIPVNPLRRVAKRFALGTNKYDVLTHPEATYLGGRMNWQDGDGQFFRERLNHVFEHLQRLRARYEGGKVPDPLYWATEDDDAAAAAWGLLTFMWAQEEGKIRPVPNTQNFGNSVITDCDQPLLPGLECEQVLDEADTQQTAQVESFPNTPGILATIARKLKSVAVAG